MHVEVGDRQYSLRVYEEPGQEQYIASCQVLRYGDRAFLYGLNGSGFYRAILETTAALAAKDIHRIECYVSRAHARLLMRVLKQTDWTLERGEEGVLDGHRLVWVCLHRQ